MKFVKEISLFAKKQHQFQRQIIGDEERKEREREIQVLKINKIKYGNLIMCKINIFKYLKEDLMR